MEQFEKHYKNQLKFKKNNKKELLTQKIERLTPYWGEYGFDGLYINVPSGTDSSEEYCLRMSMSIGTCRLLSEEKFRKELILILYRVCARLEKEFTNPMISHDCFYYPCVHDINEDFVEEYRSHAQKYLNLSLQDYLEKGKPDDN